MAAQAVTAEVRASEAAAEVGCRPAGRGAAAAHTGVAPRPTPTPTAAGAPARRAAATAAARVAAVGGRDPLLAPRTKRMEGVRQEGRQWRLAACRHAWRLVLEARARLVFYVCARERAGPRARDQSCGGARARRRGRPRPRRGRPRPRPCRPPRSRPGWGCTGRRRRPRQPPRPRRDRRRRWECAGRRRRRRRWEHAGLRRRRRERAEVPENPRSAPN